MIVEFDKSFFKTLTKVKDESTFKKIKKCILKLENTKGLVNIKNLKKLTGFKSYYRIRIGDYRLGFDSIDEKGFD